MPRTRAKGTQDGPGRYDLGAHRLAGRFDVAVLGPSGEPTPVVITLCSRYGAEYRTRATAAARARLDAASAGATVPEPGTDEDVAALAGGYVLDLLVALTVAWAGVVVDGETLPCTPDHVRALYTSEGLGWLYDQVAEEYFRRERFFVRPGSAS